MWIRDEIGPHEQTNRRHRQLRRHSPGRAVRAGAATVRDFGAHPGSLAIRRHPPGWAAGRRREQSARLLGAAGSHLAQRNDPAPARNQLVRPVIALLDNGAVARDESEACTAKIAAYLSSLPAAPLVVIKEPRITTLSDLWFKAARQAGFDVASVIAVRHPQEVISSIVKSWHVSPALASALWLKCNILAERNTRDVPRVFVDYANLLDDWRREMKRISTELPIELDTQDEDAVEAFLTPGLHRQRHCGPVTDLFGADWISLVYDGLREAAQDDPSTFQRWTAFSRPTARVSGISARLSRTFTVYRTACSSASSGPSSLGR